MLHSIKPRRNLTSWTINEKNENENENAKENKSQRSSLPRIKSQSFCFNSTTDNNGSIFQTLHTPVLNERKQEVCTESVKRCEVTLDSLFPKTDIENWRIVPVHFTLIYELDKTIQMYNDKFLLTDQEYQNLPYHYNARELEILSYERVQLVKQLVDEYIQDALQACSARMTEEEYRQMISAFKHNILSCFQLQAGNGEKNSIKCHQLSLKQLPEPIRSYYANNKIKAVGYKSLVNKIHKNIDISLQEMKKNRDHKIKNFMNIEEFLTEVFRDAGIKKAFKSILKGAMINALCETNQWYHRCAKTSGVDTRLPLLMKERIDFDPESNEKLYISVLLKPIIVDYLMKSSHFFPLHSMMRGGLFKNRSVSQISVESKSQITNQLNQKLQNYLQKSFLEKYPNIFFVDRASVNESDLETPATPVGFSRTHSMPEVSSVNRLN